jgi:hypothetical protein
MSGLDEESLLMGELRAEMRESKEQRRELFRKTDEVAKQVAGIAAQMGHVLALAQQAAKVPALETELEEMRPIVQAYRDERIGRRAVAVAAGAVGAALTTIAPAAWEAVRAWFRANPN